MEYAEFLKKISKSRSVVQTYNQLSIELEQLSKYIYYAFQMFDL